ncbi:MAG: hypothetical protein NVSMB12_17920 [Acidimicrobiales bacterium]
MLAAVALTSAAACTVTCGASVAGVSGPGAVVTGCIAAKLTAAPPTTVPRLAATRTVSPEVPEVASATKGITSIPAHNTSGTMTRRWDMRIGCRTMGSSGGDRNGLDPQSPVHQPWRDRSEANSGQKAKAGSI